MPNYKMNPNDQYRYHIGKIKKLSALISTETSAPKRLDLMVSKKYHELKAWNVKNGKHVSSKVLLAKAQGSFYLV